MTKNKLLDKLMSKVKWRECVRDIVDSDVKFIVDYDEINIVGYPSLFQLKVWVHEMFDIVYFYPQSQYKIFSDNNYIEISKNANNYYLKVGKYESKVELTRSSL